MYILIIGSGTQEYTLAKYLQQNKDIDGIFVAPGNAQINEIATCIDIQTTDISGLTEFVKANEIGLTVTFNKDTIAAGIADAFNDANLVIFAPTKDAAKITLSKAICKKFMYKTKILTPKFSISDKENTAIEYLNNANFPVVIKNDISSNDDLPIICNSFSQAKRVVELKFLAENPKIIIEEFIEGKEYSLYFVTDGYNAIPLMSVVPYKYASPGLGGSLTSGMGAYAPAQNLDKEKILDIQRKIVYPALQEMARNDNLYIGILGVNIIVTPEDYIYTINFSSGIDVPDVNSIFNLLNENFVNVAKAAITGALSEDYKEFKTFNGASTSAVLTSPNYKKSNIKNSVIEGLDNLDDDIDVVFNDVKKNEYLEYEVTGCQNIILTTKASTLSCARQKLYDNIQQIKYADKKYLPDVGIMSVSKW